MEPITVADPITCEESERVINAISRVLGAVVRLFSRFVRGKVMVEVLVREIVKCAIADIEQSRAGEPGRKGKTATLSELCVKTGLDTRMLKKVIREPLRATQENISVEAAILGFWAKDPTLRDPTTGKPGLIPIRGTSGTLEGLTLRFGGRGVTIHYMLNRLVEQGNVEVVNKHWARLVSPDWIFFKNNEDAFLDYAVEGIACIAKAIHHNLQKRDRHQEKWVERKRYSYTIPISKYKTAEQELNTYLIECWEGAGRILRKYEIAEGEAAGTVVTMGAGFYFWGEELDELNQSRVRVSEPGVVQTVLGPFRESV